MEKYYAVSCQYSVLAAYFGNNSQEVCWTIAMIEEVASELLSDDYQPLP